MNELVAIVLYTAIVSSTVKGLLQQSKLHDHFGR